MQDWWKLTQEQKVLPPIGFKPSPAEKEDISIGEIVHSEEFTHVFGEKKLDLGETVLDKFWISDGPWILTAKATIFNKDEIWMDPVLILRAEATDSNSEAMAYGGAVLHRAWEGRCQLHTQSQAIMFVTCSVRCTLGTGLLSEVKVWAQRPQ